MAFTVTLYNFSKRKNSTAVPSSGTNYSCVVKNGTSVVNPYLEFDFGLTSDPSQYNYMYIPAFERYYWIKDWTFADRLWTATAECDVLASWKNNIINTTAFVAYAASSISNNDIVDNRISFHSTAAVHTKSLSSSLFTSGTNGAVVISVTGANGCTSYAMSPSTATVLMNNLGNWIESVSPLADIAVGSDTGQAIGASANAIVYTIRQLFSQGSASENIRSAVQVPVPVSSLSGTYEQVYLGNYDAGVSGLNILTGDRIVFEEATIAIPWGGSLNWTRNAPYVELYFYHPFLGTVELSVGDWRGYGVIYIRTVMDVITGDCITTLSCEGTSSGKLAQYSYNVGAAFPIGSSNVSFATATSSLLGGAAGVAASIATGGIAGALGAGTSALTGLIAANKTSGSAVSNGGGGAGLGVAKSYEVIVVEHSPVATESNKLETIGEPWMRCKTIGDFSGYVETRFASVSGNMTSAEKDTINSMLDNGVYIE